MVIQFDLPFRLEIFTCGADGRTESCNNSPVKFYDSISDLNVPDYKPEINIKENTDVFVFVQTKYPFKMQMEGMDILPGTPFKHGQQFYLNEANREIKIFSHKDFPLSPGEYVITVNCDGKKFYTGFSVGTVRLTPALWEQMASETYNEIKEMAKHLVRQKLGIYNGSDLEEHNISIYYRIIALEESYFKVIAALNDLKNNPHSRIVKKYYLTEKNNKKGYGDFRSVSLNKRKHCIDKIYVSSKYKDYNLSENRYVKKVVKNIKKLIQEFIEEAGATTNNISKELNVSSVWVKGTQFLNRSTVLGDLREVVDNAKKVRYAITLLEECEWYKNIKDTQTDYFPTQSILDPRYEILDKLNKQLKATTIGFLENNNLAVAWKRSSELYELWGFIQIIKIFKTFKFELVDGPWITYDNGEVHLGGLKSGDVVRMEYSNLSMEYSKLSIVLTFDGKMSHSAADTNIKNPIYVLDTSKHISPDCRIDFYVSKDNNDDNKVYLGSLIADFKYRAYQSIWSDSPEVESANKQLYSYGIFTRSEYLLGKPKIYSNNALKPVYEVWALHPNNRLDVSSSHPEYGVYLYPLVPGKTNIVQEQMFKFIDMYIKPAIKLSCSK